MADRADIDKNILQNKPKQEESPYKFHGNYTKEELGVLADFMHAEFPHITYGGGEIEKSLLKFHRKISALLMNGNKF